MTAANRRPFHTPYLWESENEMGIKSFDSVVSYLKGKAILVANRGIPARRICRSIRERFDAVAIMTATDVDKTAPSASSAHELLLLGPDPRAYLDMHRIVKLAKQRDIIAIHPGWGFASEDDTFPQICKEAGLVFIGSTSESMKLLGNKVQVRAGHSRGPRFRGRGGRARSPHAGQADRLPHHAQGRRRRRRPGHIRSAR